jgi:CelD/BcsL family acetyltransferase involved in cellulose biosynthesis
VRLERRDSLDDVSEWEELALRSGNVFGTPEFLSTWWRWFGGDRNLHAFAVRDCEGSRVGLLPLYEWRAQPVRVLRFLGHGAGDQLGPLAVPAVRGEVASALLRLLEEARAPVLVAEQLPRDEGWSERLGGRRISSEGSPVLRLTEGTWEAYLAEQSANLRQQIGRLERRLAKAHHLRYSLVATPAELEAGLDALFALHRARWSPAETNFGRREGFHREFARLAFERGWARLWVLEIDERPAAAWYGLRFADTESYYQMGRDPSWDRWSVGFVLLVHSLRETFADGLKEYRFLRGGESYKYRFASDDPGLESVLVARGAGGAAAVAAVRAGLALRQAARDALAARRLGASRLPGQRAPSAEPQP